MPRHIPARPEQTQLPAIHQGDRVRSVHAGRTGTVVKVYADGSGAILWDDGEPQPEGLAHERMPRRLLEVLEPATPDHAEHHQSQVLTALRGIRTMVSELAPIADDRFADLGALGGAIARLAKKKDPTTRRLGNLLEYLAQDGESELSYRISEILERLDAAIELAEVAQ
jgi:hypothetical protein